MPRQITIAPHLTSEELYQRYRHSQEAVAKSHYQIIWLLQQGKKTKEVAEITGYSIGWIYELVWGYNRLGPESLGDKRQDNPGKKPLLNDQQQALLWQAIQEPPSDGGLWTGPKVAQWMGELLGKRVHPQRGWEYLRGLEYVRRRPRPAHVESDPAEQEAWKKKITQTVAEVKQDYPSARVEAWAEDEHRIGLKPINRIIWVQKGENPIAEVNWKFEWLWLVGFVHPQSGETYWWIVPRLNWRVFEEILADFASHFGIGQQRRVVLALDQASFHTTEKLEVPEGIHLLWMPPKSPELQPAERLWPLTDEPLANRVFSGLDELEEVLCQRCRALIKRPEWIRGYTKYHWWPVDLN